METADITEIADIVQRRERQRMRAFGRVRVLAGALVVGLLAGGCSSGPSGDPASSSAGPASVGPASVGPSSSGPAVATSAAPAAATPLEPLPVAVPAALAPYYAQRPVWQPCDSGFECTTFRVPLDYDHPGDGDLTLAAARAAAEPDGPASASQGTRLGSLLLNPGGPGGSAIEYLEATARTYDRGVRARYDLVGLDPRGVGRSNPVSCLTGDRMDAYTSVDLAPGGPPPHDPRGAPPKQLCPGGPPPGGPPAPPAPDP
ncbi:hypothetical protein ACFRAR_13925, partial [Kitasatospora sp. NPDC056651]